MFEEGARPVDLAFGRAHDPGFRHFLSPLPASPWHHRAAAAPGSSNGISI
jgi:hypothetical protein